MPVAFSLDTNDDGSGTTGTLHNAAWKTAMETAINAAIGDWTAWTPTIGGSTSQSGQAYSVQVGRYKKTNKGIEFQCRVTLSTLGTITGSVQIKGLPTAATSTANRQAAVHVGFFNNLTTSVVFLAGFINPSESAITLQMLTAAAAGTASLAQANLANTSDFIVAGRYEID